MSVDTDVNVLSQFDTFFSSSGLKQLAQSLSVSTASQNVAGDAPNAMIRTLAALPNSGGGTTNFDGPTTPHRMPSDQIKVIDEAYSKLRSTFVEQLSKSERATNQELELLRRRVKELEQLLAAEVEKTSIATEISDEWKSPYESLKSSLQGTLA